MIYFYDSGDPEDQPSVESWELFAWFIPLDKGRIKTGSKGVRIFPERDTYETAEIFSGDTLTRMPFRLTEEMRQQFIKGIFKAL